MSRRFLGTLGLLLILGAASLAGVFRSVSNAQQQFVHQAALAREEANRIGDGVVRYSDERVVAGLTFGAALARLGVAPVTAATIVQSTQGIYDLRRIRIGNRLEIGRSAGGELRSILYQVDGDHMLSIRSRHQDFEADVQPIPSHLDVVTVRGQVHDSLFRAVQDAGEGPELAMRLAEIFGWDLDFYTDPRQGDSFAIVVERKNYLDGKTAGYGRILAAEYKNAGRPYRAVLFHDATGSPGYYSADGQSLQKSFLRSPLKFSAPITSHFSASRFHPILKLYRAHLGIDYGAPSGTPVQSIGAGRVIFAGFKGGAGNLVQIQHANEFETMYMHLSRILVQAGQRVAPGDRIGLVGMTGLATGPHLDFRILQHGVYRNFETLRLHLPPSEPVGASDLAAFTVARDEALNRLSPGILDARATVNPGVPATVRPFANQPSSR